MFNKSMYALTRARAYTFSKFALADQRHLLCSYNDHNKRFNSPGLRWNVFSYVIRQQGSSTYTQYLFKHDFNFHFPLFFHYTTSETARYTLFVICKHCLICFCTRKAPGYLVTTLLLVHYFGMTGTRH